MRFGKKNLRVSRRSKGSKLLPKKKANNHPVRSGLRRNIRKWRRGTLMMRRKSSLFKRILSPNLRHVEKKMEGSTEARSLRRKGSWRLKRKGLRRRRKRWRWSRNGENRRQTKGYYCPFRGRLRRKRK